MAKSAHCPVCKKPRPEPSSPAAKHAPFCSARCRDVDLGSWLNEGYRISRPMMPFELDRALVEGADADEEN